MKTAIIEDRTEDPTEFEIYSEDEETEEKPRASYWDDIATLDRYARIIF